MATDPAVPPKSLADVAEVQSQSMLKLLKTLPEPKAGETELSTRAKFEARTHLARLDLWAEATERLLRTYDKGAADRFSIPVKFNGPDKGYDEFLRRVEHYAPILKAIRNHPEYATRYPAPSAAPEIPRTTPPELEVLANHSLVDIIKAMKAHQIWALVSLFVGVFWIGYGLATWRDGVSADRADISHQRQLQAESDLLGDCRRGLATAQQKLKAAVEEAPKPKK